MNRLFVPEGSSIVPGPTELSMYVQIARDISDVNIKNALNIGVSGGRGSFSDQVGTKYARERFARGRSNRRERERLAMVQISWLITAEGVLTALKDGDIDVGIVPVSNNRAGWVRENGSATAEHRFRWELDEADGLPRNIKIPIEHILMKRPDAPAYIHDIVTQLQADGQCMRKRRALLPEARVFHYPDTALAAEHLADGTLKDHIPEIRLKYTAVLGPENAAKVNGLTVHQHDMNDFKNNETTFGVALPFYGK